MNESPDQNLTLTDHDFRNYRLVVVDLFVKSGLPNITSLTALIKLIK
jgi:hypothetical protein